MANKKPSASGAEAARLAAAQLRARQQAAARRRTSLLVVAALALVAVFAVIVVLIVRASAAVAPSAADASGGILVGPGGVAGAEVNPDAIRVEIYEDPICPFCGLFSESTAEELGALLDAGEIVVYYHPVAYFDSQSMGTRYSTRAASAMATVAEYDPDHFFDFVHLLLSEPVQPEEGTTGLTDEQIAEVASAAGVSAEAVAKIADHEFKRWVAQASERASVDGVGGTPTVLIGGVFFGNNWMTAGNLSVAVGIVKEYGPEALTASLAGEDALAPSPSPAAP